MNPEDAQRALQDIDAQQHKAIAGAAWPRAWWIGGGLLLIACGVLAVIFPRLFGHWTWWPVVMLAALALIPLSWTRRGHQLTGRSVRARPLPGPARWVIGTAAAVLIVILTWLSPHLHSAHIGAAIAIGGGLLMALAGPWWDRHTLQHQAVRR